MFDVNQVNRSFFKLQRVGDNARRADAVRNFAGRATHLLNNYMLAENPLGCGYVEKKFSNMGAVTLERIDTLSLVDDHCYTNSVVVLRDADNVMWLDAVLEDIAFE